MTGRADHLQAGNFNVHKICNLALSVLLINLRTLEVVVISLLVSLQLALDRHAVPNVVRKLYG